MDPSIGLDKAQMHGLVLAQELFKMSEHIGRCGGIYLDATLQESTFPSSFDLGIHVSGVIRNEETHPRFSPYPGIYQAASVGQGPDAWTHVRRRTL